MLKQIKALFARFMDAMIGEPRRPYRESDESS